MGSNLKSILTFMAASGAAGVAAQAHASTTQTYGYTPDSGFTVTIGDSATAQYTYGIINLDDSEYGLKGNLGSSIGEVSNSPGLPNAGESYGQTKLQTAVKNDSSEAALSLMAVSPSIGSAPGYTSLVPSNGEYAHLSFDIDSTAYVGSAFIDGNAVLQSITYEKASEVSAAPEPDAWALLVAGVGMAGMVMRRRRSAQLAAVA